MSFRCNKCHKVVRGTIDSDGICECGGTMHTLIEVVSVGRWKDRLISVKGPMCPVEKDGVHKLYEFDYYGEPTGELTCKHPPCNLFAPQSDNYLDDCNTDLLVHGDVPDDMWYDLVASYASRKTLV